MNPRLHTSTSLRLLTVAIACCAVALAGCSGEESSNDATTTSADESEPTTVETDEGTDTLPEMTFPDTELCQLASEESPDLSGLPDLLPEELRAEATQFAQEYNEWRATGGDAAPPDAPEGIIDFITQECTPELDGSMDPDTPTG